MRSRRRLDRSSSSEVEGALVRAQRALAEVRLAATPTSKLRSIARAVEAVSSELASADDLLQSLIRALLTSEIRSPHAEVAFVLEYAHNEVSNAGIDGYTLATFQAAAEAVSSLEIDVLFAAEESANPESELEVALAIGTAPEDDCKCKRTHDELIHETKAGTQP